MPRLPSSADVPTVSPRVATDPGVEAPAQAFESPLGIAAEELKPVIDKFAEVKLKQDNRRDTVDRSSRINQYNSEADEELRRLNTEEDLSREDILGKYGEFLSQRLQASVGEHGGSEDSRAKLTIRLQDVEAAATGRAAGISAKIGRDKVKATFNESLTPLAIRASQNPSLENIDQIFLDFETQLDDLRDAFDPAEEDELRRSGREQLVLSAIEPLITRGRVETAEGLLIEGGLFQSLSAATQRNIRRRIDTVRFNRDETLKDLTEREKRVQQLTARGLSQPLSEDIAAKDVRVVGPDKFGEFFSVNLATGKKTKIEGDDKDAILEIVPPEALEAPKVPEDGTSIEEAVQEGTGPFAKIQAGLSNVIGPFVEGALFKDTTDARQQVRTFSQIAKTALVNNPRFPVAEQKIVQNLLPDVDTFFQDPDTARSNLKELKAFLTKQKIAKDKELTKGRVSAKRKADLTDQVSRIDELLTLMESPKTVKILDKDIKIGEIVTNNKGQKGRVEADGSITVIE